MRRYVRAKIHGLRVTTSALRYHGSVGIDDELLKGFDEASEGAQPMPAIPEMGAVWQFWGGAEVSIINGQATPEEAWTAMNENIKAAFEG